MLTFTGKDKGSPVCVIWIVLINKNTLHDLCLVTHKDFKKILQHKSVSIIVL